MVSSLKKVAQLAAARRAGIATSALGSKKQQLQGDISYSIHAHAPSAYLHDMAQSSPFTGHTTCITHALRITAYSASIPSIQWVSNLIVIEATRMKNENKGFNTTSTATTCTDGGTFRDACPPIIGGFSFQSIE